MYGQRMPRLRSSLLPIIAATLVLGFATPSIATPTKVGVSATDTTYVAVIDAGSSGTRLSLFTTASGVTVAQVYRAPNNTPGLSSFASNTAAAGPDAVAPLLDQLSTYVEGQGIAPADVPVALLATAGMRRLRLNDPVAVREIFASTRATIMSSDFPLRANKILPDVQEALLAWLDANARAGTLDKPREDIGIVEVGGASAQVAFRSPTKSGPGVSTVTVSGKEIGVVAVSYLGLGANESRDAMQAATSGGAFCFPNNASGIDPQSYLASTRFPVASNQADFRGSPCGRAYSGVIQDVASLSIRDVRPRNLSKLPGFARANFVGLGAIPFIYADFKIDPGANAKTSLQVAVRSTCKGADAWLSVRALYPAPTPELAETRCSTGSYLGQFFFGPTGIGLDPARFQAQPDLPGGEPSWSEGYAITVLHP
jgi:hypothetical protein